MAEFKRTKFQGLANFHRATFEKIANFYNTRFQESRFDTTAFKGITNFCYAAFFDRTFFTDDCKFHKKTFFNNVLFVDKEKVIFDVENLSKVSFMNTDITQIEFGENCLWGGKEDKFKIVDEQELEYFLNTNIQHLMGMKSKKQFVTTF